MTEITPERLCIVIKEIYNLDCQVGPDPNEDEFNLVISQPYEGYYVFSSLYLAKSILEDAEIAARVLDVEIENAKKFMKDLKQRIDVGEVDVLE